MNNFDVSFILDSLPYLLKGLQFSLILTAVAFSCGIALGTILALLVHLRVPVLGLIAKTYVALIRSIPLIMVLFWFFFLVPLFLGWLSGASRPVPVGATWTAFITFALFEAAYYCEIIRVGLRAVPKGQFEAAAALSLNPCATYLHVILPQVFRATVPIILTQTIILFQDTSLVYVLSLTDLLGAASKLAQISGRLTEFYLTIALIYLVICFGASQLVWRLRKKTKLQ
ncbi:amino acid ABC transporter permease [Thalassospira mesophila]|uniref:Glutamate/aspartate import permease protein GltK n=1 Tax=Thalassospira mesophila TaxID=1293891 RepID=A0A1Y2KY04_9PROT|nr:amino acid ABC transporter permease [Thalassospira mesophila]OSQ37355.1 amino acid ABC transporter permease [Thalassospira mesophila]